MVFKKAIEMEDAGAEGVYKRQYLALQMLLKAEVRVQVHARCTTSEARKQFRFQEFSPLICRSSQPGFRYEAAAGVQVRHA